MLVSRPGWLGVSHVSAQGGSRRIHGSASFSRSECGHLHDCDLTHSFKFQCRKIAMLALRAVSGEFCSAIDLGAAGLASIPHSFRYCFQMNLIHANYCVYFPDS